MKVSVLLLMLTEPLAGRFFLAVSTRLLGELAGVDMLQVLRRNGRHAVAYRTYEMPHRAAGDWTR
jgi:hypothetical protein